MSDDHYEVPLPGGGWDDLRRLPGDVLRDVDPDALTDDQRQLVDDALDGPLRWTVEINDKFIYLVTAGDSGTAAIVAGNQFRDDPDLTDTARHKGIWRVRTHRID